VKVEASIVWESFILSLITNTIVMMGAISLFFWLRSYERENFISRHRKLVSTAFIYAFYLYLYLQSIANVTLGPNAYGMHWTFLNLLIVTAFIFNIVMKSKWITGVYITGTSAYVVLFTHQLSPLIILLLVVNLLLQLWFYKYGLRPFIESRLLSAAVLAVFAVLSFCTIYLMAPETLDTWFFVRQIAAFVIISTSACEFTRYMVTFEKEADDNKKLVNWDAMTSVKNFGAFNQDLAALYANFQKTGEQYTLIEMDIDYFKRVNDQYGHLMGNVVLEELSAQMKKIVETLDYPATVYRVGGEEFCIIVHKKLDDPHFELTRRLKKSIDELVFTTRTGQTFGVTVSIGQEYSSTMDNHYLDIYNNTDKSLYMSKQAGRNKITVNGKILAS
jgi:diguanylate cyclase (GGDEF)-like protein